MDKALNSITERMDELFRSSGHHNIITTFGQPSITELNLYSNLSKARVKAKRYGRI